MPIENVECPECGGPMKSRANKTTGQRFWGCANYPTCKGTRNTYPNEDDGYLPLEVEQVRLAELVLQAFEEQSARERRLPERAVPVVIEMSMRPRRRREV